MSPQKPYRDLQSIALDEGNRAKRNAGRAHIYALEIPFSVIIGVVLGKFVDDHFQTAPYGLTIGLVAGLAAAVRAIMAVIAWQKSLSSGDEKAQDIGYDDGDTGARGGEHHEP
jgi:F0F1-type ATP synthase assembly protein I